MKNTTPGAPCPRCGESMSGHRNAPPEMCRACRDEANLDAPFPANGIGGTQRAKYGCIVTFENVEGGRLTVTREGPPRAGVKQACAIALAQDETYRVISVSTPETIYRDLTGGTREAFADDAWRHRVHIPERAMGLPEETLAPSLRYV